MASPKLDRNLYYYRFTWDGSIDKKLSKQSFQSVLESILKNTPHTDDRVILLNKSKEGYITGQKNKQFHDQYANNVKALCIHIAFYEPGTLTNLVSVPIPAPDVDIETQEAPKLKNWMDGAAFLMITKNEIFCCPCNVRCKSAFEYLSRYLGKHLNLNPSDIHFTPMANIDAISLISQEGVSNIGLNMALSQAELIYKKTKSFKSGLLRSITPKIRKLLRESLGHDGQAQNLPDKECVNVKLVLSIDSNDKAVSAEQLKNIGCAVINDNDHEEFTITTGKGKTVSHDDLRINKPVKLYRYGKTVEKNEAWDALINYYKELEEDGILVR